MKMSKIRILIVDDHPYVRDGIVSLVATEKDMQVVAQAGDGPEALMLAKKLEPGGCPTSHFAGARRVGLTANQLNL